MINPFNISQTASHPLPRLPHLGDIENRTVLKKAALAHQALAELKGVTASMPNPSILVDTLSLQEAKDSSEIENIITTHNDLYSSDFARQQFTSTSAKEVHQYAHALRSGFDVVSQAGLLTLNHIRIIQKDIEGNDAGFRVQSGTTIKNAQTGEVVYTPPQHPDEILELMTNLEQFMNEPDLCDWDPLVKMAVIHHQFESIHPFYDGNGRTGRVINILFLVQQKLLDTPVLYLSRYINRTKNEYYHLLQAVREEGVWEQWIIYMLNAIEKTARDTTQLIHEVSRLMQRDKERLRADAPKIYSQDLINSLFRHPYTKIDLMSTELQVARQTASKYLDVLTQMGILEKIKLGKDNYYINIDLYHLLLNVGLRGQPNHDEPNI